LGAPPVSKPVPVQLVASVLLHVRSLEPPRAIVVGLALSVTVTGGPIVSVAFAGGLVAPPLPLQVTE
jgi:hypothetical protein